VEGRDARSPLDYAPIIAHPPRIARAKAEKANRPKCLLHKDLRAKRPPPAKMAERPPRDASPEGQPIPEGHSLSLYSVG